MNLAEIFWESESEYVGKPLLYMEGRKVSFGEAGDGIRKFLGVLGTRSIKPNDIVILAVPNSVEWLISFFAIVSAGGVCVPVNPALTAGEIATIVRHCRPNLVVASTELLGSFVEFAGSISIIEIDLQDPGSSEWHKLLESSSPVKEVVNLSADHPALIFYTSGTTGVPKGVLLSHGAELFTADLVSRHMVITRRDTSLVMGSLAFRYHSILNMVSSIKGGASLILQSRFHPATAAADIQRYGATFLMGVPTMYIMMANWAATNEADFSSVRLALTAGASFPNSLRRRIREQLHLEVFDLWGLTECSPITSFDPVQETEGEPDSCGRAMPGCELRIADPDLQEVEVGKIGEILVKSPGRMTGYYKDPVSTEATIVDGWLRSGDLGKVDARGLLYIVGRSKDLIIRGGANVYPLDVEEVLYRHPSVVECAVIGKPDPLFGETVLAFIVTEGEASAESILNHCRETLATYKVPNEVRFVQRLPKGPTGKILKRQLREQLLNQDFH